MRTDQPPSPFLAASDCGKISKAGMEKGVWDAVHVVEAAPEGKDKAEYKLTSTVMLSATKKDLFKLEGNLTRQLDRSLPVKQGHIPNIGMIVEELEGSMRNSLQQVGRHIEARRSTRFALEPATLPPFRFARRSDNAPRVFVLTPGLLWLVRASHLQHQEHGNPPPRGRHRGPQEQDQDLSGRAGTRRGQLASPS
mmetsp:Transcript_12251/g.34081  ORF Transcript_12251/g.34081 Transcript_12251/m.34081 type:complete len:195 (+) Transcript_12251:488-1072(+)